MTQLERVQMNRAVGHSKSEVGLWWWFTARGLGAKRVRDLLKTEVGSRSRAQMAGFLSGGQYIRRRLNWLGGNIRVKMHINVIYRKRLATMSGWSRFPSWQFVFHELWYIFLFVSFFQGFVQQRGVRLVFFRRDFGSREREVVREDNPEPEMNFDFEQMSGGVRGRSGASSAPLAESLGDTILLVWSASVVWRFFAFCFLLT